MQHISVRFCCSWQCMCETHLQNSKQSIIYIKATVSVCLFVFYLFFTYFFFSDVISLSLPLWRNPIGSHSLWSVLGGGGRESPVKHGVGGASMGGGGDGRGRTERGKLDGCIMHQVHTSYVKQL
jgi:hypothetical protein